MTHYWNVKCWMLRLLCSCTALQRKARKACLYCNSPGKVPTLSSNRSMIGLTEFCWDQKLNRKLFIEINFDATVVKVVFLHGTKLLSKIKVSHLPFPSMLLDPPCNNKGRKVEQLVMFCYNYVSPRQQGSSTYPLDCPVVPAM